MFRNLVLFLFEISSCQFFHDSVFVRVKPLSSGSKMAARDLAIRSIPDSTMEDEIKKSMPHILKKLTFNYFSLVTT